MTANTSALVTKINALVEKSDWIRMAGTEQTWEYQVIASTTHGRVGVRDFTHTGTPVRIRVEPFQGKTLESLARDAGWKQPGDSGQCRYSIVRPAGCEAACALRTALTAIGIGTVETVVNPDAPLWAVEVAYELLNPVLGQMAKDIDHLRQQEAVTEQQLSQGNAQADRLQSMIEALMRQLNRQREANENLYEQATSLQNERHGLNAVRGQQVEALASLFAAGYTLGTPVPEVVEPELSPDFDDVDEITSLPTDEEVTQAYRIHERQQELLRKSVPVLMRLYKNVNNGVGHKVGIKRADLVEMILQIEFAQVAA